jgi:hypothetical protein
VVKQAKRPANSSLQIRVVAINQQRCVKKVQFVLDQKSQILFYGISLQTLHRMPSDQWGYRPVIPTAFFLTLSKEGIKQAFGVPIPKLFLHPARVVQYNSVPIKQLPNDKKFVNQLNFIH